MERLLQSSAPVAKDLRRLKNSTKTEIEDTVVKINYDLADSGSKLNKLQEESDSLVARNLHFSDQVKDLESKEENELNKARKALDETRKHIERAESSLEKLCNIFTVKNDPKKVFNYPPVTFSLSNFHEIKDNNEIWYSPCFYSHSCGYKMQLQVYPNGDGIARGTHVSVKVVILPGEFDDLLCWPFQGIITLHLVNQRRDTSHLAHQVWFTTLDNLHVREKPIIDEREEDTRRIGDGVDMFVAHASLGEKAGILADKEYLKNNMLLFCVWNVDVFYQHH